MWNRFTPSDIVWYRWKLDGASVYLRKNGDEWRAATVPVRIAAIEPEAGGPDPEDPPEGAQVAFAVAEGATVALRPYLPEQPYLIVVRNDLRIMAGAEARFDVALPPRYRAELPSGEAVLDYAPFILSSTWFGDKTGGTLCGSLPTALDPQCRGEIETGDGCCAEPDYRALVGCEITVRNASRFPIDLKRLAIYTGLLNIYERGGRLVTDPVRVDGLEDGSLRMTVQAPAPGTETGLLTAARGGQREMLVSRGVKFLRAITGI